MTVVHINVWKKIRTYFREYCENSSIHGFRYFGEKRTHFERGWWFLVFLTTQVVCGYCILLVYEKWDSSPIIVSFAKSETPTFKIPFPAVTICPETKVTLRRYNHTAALEALSNLKNISDKELPYFAYMLSICELLLQRNLTEPTEAAKKFQSTINTSMQYFNNENLLKLNLYNPILDCHSSSVDCEFTSILTDDGVCFTFNMLGDNLLYKRAWEDKYTETYSEELIDWNLDSGYSSNSKTVAFPQRALATGIKNALTVRLSTPKIDDDFMCRKLAGYRVTLHTPSDEPRVYQTSFMVPHDQIVFGQIQPKMIQTSNTLKRYSPESRDCYLSGDRELAFFTVYTQSNCRLECLANLTKQECGCVAVYMPRQSNTTICVPNEFNIFCIDLQIITIDFFEINNQIEKDSKNSDKIYKLVDQCKCLPNCNDISYDVTLSQAQWDWKRETVETDYYGHNLKQSDNVHASKLLLYFKSSHFVSYRRHELYGPTDFLANFGGLLGLFTGISVLSIMEILYFLTFRLFFNVRIHGNWYGRNIG